MSEESLNALRARVYEDAALARRLRAIEPASFVAEVTRIAAESGIEVTSADLEDAVERGRQAWMLRWIL